MLEGCASLMGSPSHGRSGFEFLDVTTFDQDMAKSTRLESPNMVFYPSSPRVISLQKNHTNKLRKSEGDLTAVQILSKSLGEDGGELGCAAYGTSSWKQEDVKGALEDLGGSRTPTAVRFPIRSSPSPPLIPRSPEVKLNSAEPRSVLDLAISPQQPSRSVLPTYASLQGQPELDEPDPLLTHEFHRVDSSAHLLPLVDDSLRWEGPTVSGPDSPHDNPLWMDLFMDEFKANSSMDSIIGDLGMVSTQTSLPGLETEGEEARTNSMDTPTSSPSECHKSESSDQDPSEEEGNEEGSQTRAEASEDTRKPYREVGLELVNLLLACAEAVATESLSLVNPLFAQLGELASPEGTSMQRLAAYYTEGLATRCSRLWPQIYRPLPFNLDQSEEDHLSAFLILNHVCPYIKFSQFTANEIILQAFEHCDRVHVIDFDIKQGLQWPALFQSLAARPGGPPSHVRVTGIGDCKEDVQDAGDRLAEFAEALDLQFEFHAVIDKLEDVRLWMLHVKEKEVVAINCIFQLHRTLHDAKNGMKDMLGLIMSTKPKVVALVEQEASHNGDFFDGRSPRFLESLQHYAALFDSLDFSMPPDSMARVKVEQFFAREIRNIVGYEGSERVERHEKYEEWREHFGRGGFKSTPLGRRARSQARLLLEMFSCKDYTLTERAGALMLGWRNRPLFTASAWVPSR